MRIARPSYFSIEVAKLVTQPFCIKIVSLYIEIGETAAMGGRSRTWPSRVPLRISCSAIVYSLASAQRIEEMGEEREF